ncbi:hypothetical protein SI65_04059 [Aspergillus cristatus]|uniref:Cutinase n=1 Tax=Aspergillus cristatus TaxID=573508 RepID=A0A1E3BKU6_ASPCR|nr:hypothetical protein SI65_04059 [Aspergillus cristatus]
MKYSLTLIALASTALTAPTQPEERGLFPGFGDSSSGFDSGFGNLFGGGSGSSDSDSSSGTSSASGAASTPSSTSTTTSAQGTDALGDFTDLLGGSFSSVGGTTENGVTDNNGCQPLTFIFARGTTELGNMGSVVGPPVAKQLASQTNNKVTVQGVDYPADAAGNASLGSSGGPKMASLVKQALKQCPNTKVVLGGYSQGSMVVHNAANSLSADQISAAVLFGDPFKAQSVGKLDDSKRKEYCAQGDPVCLNGGNIMAHLSYGKNAEEAAKFLVEASGVNTS